jgi:hypothetical protein
VLIPLSLPRGDHSVSISFFASEPNCQGTIEGTGFNDGNVVSYWNSTSLSGLTVSSNTTYCTATWLCTGSCVMTGANQQITATLTNPGISAMAVNYSASVPYYKGTQYLLSSALFYPSTSKVFRGPTYTDIVVQAIPVVFTQIANPIITSINPDVSRALQLSHFSYSPGSSVDSAGYTSVPDSVSVRIELVVLPTTLFVNETQQTTVLTTIVNIRAYVAIVVTVVALLFPVFEFVEKKIHEKVRGPSKDIPVEGTEKQEPKTLQNNFVLEMTETKSKSGLSPRKVFNSSFDPEDVHNVS